MWLESCHAISSSTLQQMELELELCSHVADNVDQDNEDLQKWEEQPTDDRNVNLFSHFNQII